MPQDTTSTSIEPVHSFTVSDILRRTALRMAYQPIVALDVGKLVAFEALARTSAPSADAAGLFALAAREQLVPQLDHLAHSLALASAPYLADDALLFINASPITAAHADFPRRLARLARFAGVEPRRVVVEITELGDTSDDDALARNLADLRSLGFGTALDDLGAGHSDLRRLLRLRPQWLKLDRALTQRLESDRYARSLVEALVRFAQRNALRVVAEGIELPSQARAVADLGIAFAQGFWFAHPVGLPQAASSVCTARVQRRWRAASHAA
jgi:EAL domain-containing protein (putative c-di-GMP-specific phosphodiesterase class I)